MEIAKHKGPEICSSIRTTCGLYDQASWECSTRQAFSETRQLGPEAWIQDLQAVLPGCTRGSFLNQKEEMKGEQVLGVFSDMLIGTSVSPLSPAGDLTLPGAQD